MVQYRTTIGATASIIQESGGSSCSALKDMAMGPGCFHIQMAMLGPNPKVVKHAQTVALIDVVCQKCSSLVSHPDFNKPCIMESSKKGSSTIKFQIVSVFIQKHRQHSLANCVFLNQSQGAKNQRCAASRPLVQHIVLTVKNVLWRTKVKTATFRPWSQLREVVLLEPLQYNILWLLEPFIPARSLTVPIQEGCSTRSTTALVDVGSVHLFWSSEAVHPYPNWCKSNNGDSCRKRVPLTTRKKSEWWLSSSSTLPITLFKHISNVNVLLKHRHYIILYYANSWYTYPMFLQTKVHVQGIRRRTCDSGFSTQTQNGSLGLDDFRTAGSIWLKKNWQVHLLHASHTSTWIRWYNII